MKEILLYTLLPYISDIKEIGFLVVCSAFGIHMQNRNNDSKEEDVKGIDILLLAILFSALIHFGMKKVKIDGIKPFTAIIFGLSGNKLLKKWLRNKVWDKFDFIGKKK